MHKKLDKGKLKYFYKETGSKSYNYNNPEITVLHKFFAWNSIS